MWGPCVPTGVLSGVMSLPVAPQSVTLYDVIKDLGFPIVVALILLFQVGPKLDDMAATNAQIEAQVQALTALCVSKSP